VALNDRVIVDGIQKVKVGQAVTPTVQAPAPTSTANQSNSSGT
jgi:hypothetical protein